MSKKTGIVAHVELIVRQLLAGAKERQTNPYHYFDGAYVIKNGEIDPKSFLTHYRVKYCLESNPNPNTINRARQKALQKIRAQQEVKTDAA